jgi:hypothetical protein
MNRIAPTAGSPTRRVVTLLLALLLTGGIVAASARAAFPTEPLDGGTVNGPAGTFAFQLEPGDRRAKIVAVEDNGLSDPSDPDDDYWNYNDRLESPWSTTGQITWHMGVFPGFYAWRLCVVNEETASDDECDLQPEIRFVKVAEGDLLPCRASFVAGFFRYLAVARAGCGTAARVARAWIKRSRFGRRGVPKRLRVGRWRCQFRLMQTDENPYGRITCTTSKRRVVRFYGVS